jgi:integrase
MLTELQIKALKPGVAEIKIHDGRGFYLRVRPNGTKSFLSRYTTPDGRPALLSQGQWPDVPLKRAREKHEALRSSVADGVDPSALRKIARIARGDTFEILALEWLERRAKTKSPNTVEKARALLVHRLFRAFGSHPINTIEPPDLLAVLQRVEADGKGETALRIRILFSQIARYAIGIGKCKRDISQDLRGALLPVVATHHAAVVEPRAIGQLLRATDNYRGFPAAKYALRLLPHVFVRPGELRGAAWSEFDLDAAEWRIPGVRMKMDREHIVPLSRQVLALLRELRTQTGDSRLLFPNIRSIDRPISGNTISAALATVGYSSKVQTAHGFRTIASTRLNEMGVNSDLIELQMSHVPQNSVRDAYNRASRLPERRKMMQTWSDALDEMRQDGALQGGP